MRKRPPTGIPGVGRGWSDAHHVRRLRGRRREGSGGQRQRQGCTGRRVAKRVERARPWRHRRHWRARVRHEDVSVAKDALWRREHAARRPDLGLGSGLERGAGRALLLARRVEDAQQVVLHRRDEDLVVEGDDVLRRLPSVTHAHLAEHLGRRLVLPLVLLDDVSERLWRLLLPLVDLAHTVDGAHDDLVEVAAPHQVPRGPLHHHLDALPDLRHQLLAQQQPEAQVVHSAGREILDLLQKLLQRGGGARLAARRFRRRKQRVVLAQLRVERRLERPRHVLEDLDLHLAEVDAQVLRQAGLVLDEGVDHLVQVEGREIEGVHDLREDRGLHAVGGEHALHAAGEE
mmetsp:Transcript_11972/g.35379  ORF Transcript_11972/g.35379 Transcript_11972/m.35379 type:complete len:345 (+) Transcript_11972:488-1522(+)